MFGFPLAAALIGAVFAVVVLRQYAHRRRAYQLSWGLALAMFAIAASFETVGAAHGWTPLTYRGYYLFGGVLNVGWLGVGSIQIIAPGRPGRVAAWAMVVITVVAVPGVWLSSIDPSHLAAAVPGRGTIGSPAILLAPLTNILGTIALVGGAAWSAWTAWRRGSAPGLVTGLALIAAGAFVVAGTHSYAQTSAVYAVQPLGEALGIAVMFCGYLVVEAQRQSHAGVSRAALG